jgi:hypothetical protein
MATGDVVSRHPASSNLTVTALNGGIASSATWVAGWTSGTIDNTSALDLDVLISAQFTVESSGLSAGQIRMYLYAMLDDSNWPDLFSAGTEGTEGTATVHDTELRDSSLYFLWATETDTTASRKYPMPPTSVLARVGFVPAKFALFLTQSTGTTLETSGNQVTVKGYGVTVTP